MDELEGLLVKLGLDASGYTQGYKDALATMDANINKMQAKLDEFEAKQKEAFDKMGGAAKKLATEEQHHLSLLERGKQITSTFATGIEKYKAAMLELNVLVKKGAIDQETYNRAVANASKLLPSYQAQLDRQAQAAAQAAAREKHLSELMNRGASIYASVMTGQQRYKAGLLELNTLLRQGALDQETYNKAVAKLGKDNLPQLNNMLKTTGMHVQALGRNMSLFITAPVVAGLSLATRETMKFEQALADLSAAANPTEAGMERIKGKAFELSKELRVLNPIQITQGFTELLKTGMDLETVLGSAGLAASKFARVGQLETETAATVMADAMKVFNETADRTVNTLSAGADASSISIRQMVESFQQVSAVAGLAQQKLDTTAAAVAILGNNAIKGSDAGTSLKTMLLRLMAPADKAADVIEKYNLKVRDANGNMLPFRDIIGELESKLGTLNNEVRDNVLFDIFGQDAIRAASVFLKEGTEGWDKMMASMNGALTVAEKFDQQTDTMTGSWEAMTAALSRMRIRLGEVVGQQFGPFLAKLTEIIDKTTEWIEQNPRLATIGVTLAAIAAAAGPVLIFFGSLASSIGTLITVGQGLSAWLVATTGQATATAGALHLLGGGALIAKAGIVALAVGGVAVLTKNLYEASEDIAALRAEMERAGELGGKGLQNIAKEQQRILDQANAMQGDAKKSFLAEQFERAKTELAGVTKNFQAQKALVDKMTEEQGLTAYLTGLNAPLDAANQELEHMKKRLQQAQAFADMLGQSMKAATTETTSGGAAAGSGVSNKLQELLDQGKEEMEQNDPLAKYNKRIGELKKMLDAAAISQEHFNNQAREAKNLLEKGQDAIDPVRALTRELEKQAATFDMTTAQARVYELKLQGATDAQLEAAQAIADKLKKMEEDKKATEKATQLVNKYLTPQQKFAKAHKELSDLFNRGLINMETYNAELAEAQKAMDKEMKVDLKVGGVDAVEKGTAEAARKFQEYMALRNVGAKPLPPPLPAAAGVAAPGSFMDPNAPSESAESNAVNKPANVAADKAREILQKNFASQTVVNNLPEITMPGVVGAREALQKNFENQPSPFKPIIFPKSFGERAMDAGSRTPGRIAEPEMIGKSSEPDKKEEEVKTLQETNKELARIAEGLQKRFIVEPLNLDTR